MEGKQITHPGNRTCSYFGEIQKPFYAHGIKICRIYLFHAHTKHTYPAEHTDTHTLFQITTFHYMRCDVLRVFTYFICSSTLTQTHSNKFTRFELLTFHSTFEYVLFFSFFFRQQNKLVFLRLRTFLVCQ